jgi:hypothetical protein
MMPDAQWAWWPDIITSLIAILIGFLVWRAVANDE